MNTSRSNGCNMHYAFHEMSLMYCGFHEISMDEIDGLCISRNVNVWHECIMHFMKWQWIALMYCAFHEMSMDDIDVLCISRNVNVLH